MSEPVRRGRPGHDQQTVLRVAIELFNRQGYDATSMGDLARELGLTKSAIYHHVPSKEHLLSVAIVVESREQLKRLFAAYEAAGVPMHQTIKKHPWGDWDFVACDPDGNLISFSCANELR